MRRAAAAVATCLLAAACGAGTASPSAPPSASPSPLVLPSPVLSPSHVPTPSPVPTPASVPTPGPTPSERPSAGGIVAPAVVTFEVAEQGTFKVELVTQDLVDHAAALLAGTTDEGRIPIGTIVRGAGGVNAPWHWHLDPATFAFADATTEVCDGLPSYVEDGTLTSPYYCPWSATVTELTPRD